MSATRTFTVIVPTYRRPHQLASCLEALAAQRFPIERVEVIVVDDGSGEPPAREVARASEALTVRLHRASHGGPGAARNAGAALASGEFLAFTDDDCAPDADWLGALAAQLERTPDAAVGGRTVNALPDNVFSAASQLLVSYLYEYYAHPRLYRRRFFTTNNLALSRAAFQELGGFDVHTPCGTAEDRDLCARCSHAGRPLIYVTEAVVHHAHPLDARSFWRQHLRYGRSALYVERARALRANDRVRLEPLSFYWGMLTYPFFSGQRGKAFLFSLLMAATQAAYAQGVLGQLLGEALSGSHERVRAPKGC